MRKRWRLSTGSRSEVASFFFLFFRNFFIGPSNVTDRDTIRRPVQMHADRHVRFECSDRSGSPGLRVLALVVLAGCMDPPPQKTIFEVTVALTPDITSATADGMTVPISGSMIVVRQNYDSYVVAQAAAPMEIKLVGTTTHTGHAQTGQCALIAEMPAKATIQKEAVLIDGTRSSLDFAVGQWDMLACFTTIGDFFKTK